MVGFFTHLFQETNEVKKGYLHKKMGKEWCRRWCVLTREGILFYYKGKKFVKPVGALYIPGSTITYAEVDDDEEEYDRRSACDFSITYCVCTITCR